MTAYGKITIDLNIDEDEQMSSRQNAALHGAPGNLAISIDACPAIPEDLTTQEAVAAYIKDQLAPLVDQGWRFEIAIGPASE